MGSSSPPAGNRPTIFNKAFRKDLEFWIRVDRGSALKVLELVEAIAADPSTGSGKPEPLKHLGWDIWSRRITQEHRLVYLVRPERIDFLMCRYHY